MRAGVKLGLAALVAVASFVALTLFKENPILLEDVEANSHGGALVGVTMTIRNAGPPDRLLSVDSAGTKMALLKGENVNPFPIPAQSTVSLAADGAHVMLGGVPGALQEGRLIPLVLTFEKAGAVNAKARFVVPMKDGDQGDMMDHSMMMGREYPVPAGEPAPTLSLTAAPRDGGGFDVQIETSAFTFSREQADGPHVPGLGHGHLYVGGVKIGRVYGATATIPPLPAGEHIVRVTLNTNDHRVYVVEGELVTATVTVTADE